MTVQRRPEGEGLARQPNLDHEWALARQGYRLIAGVDEAGRGAWAGPVYAAAVILPLERTDLEGALEGVTDSKLLTPLGRNRLLPLICETALGVGVGAASAGEIDALGIVPATRLAMRRAIEQLAPPPHALLLDYMQLPGVTLPQRAMAKADRLCLSVAAASIVAKVTRDLQMAQLGETYPGYAFAQHKGYGTAAHRQALAQLGPSPIHRMSWAPLKPTGPLQVETALDEAEQDETISLGK
jgi:ribonuclease HII